MKKVFAGILLIAIGLVAYVGITNKDLLSVTNYFSTMKDVDFKAEYVMKQTDGATVSVPAYLQNGTLAGEIRGIGTENYAIHGNLYLEGSDVAIFEYYENEEDAKYNISQLCVYMIEKIGDTTGLSLDWISSAVGDFYVAKSQLEQITGNEIEDLLPDTEDGEWEFLGSVFAFRGSDMPVDSAFSDRISEMKFYQCTDEEDSILIGIPIVFGDGSSIYIELVDRANVVELILTCTKVENGELIQMPEGQLSEKQVETIQWIYEKFMELQEKLKK